MQYIPDLRNAFDIAISLNDATRRFQLQVIFL